MREKWGAEEKYIHVYSYSDAVLRGGKDADIVCIGREPVGPEVSGQFLEP